MTTLPTSSAAQPSRVKLSAVINGIPPQHTMRFVKQLRRAVLNETIEAVYSPEYITIPSQRRRIREMVILNDTSYQAFYEAFLNHPNSVNARTRTAELIEGTNWNTELHRTRNQIRQRTESGQALAATGKGTASKTNPQH